jgi:hypothetical protein
MDPSFLLGIASLGQPRPGSVYEESGTADSGYEEKGPYHCEDCIHKTAQDEPFCVHPAVLADPELQSRVVLLDNRPVSKINLKHGCCKFVKQMQVPKEESDHE